MRTLPDKIIELTLPSGTKVNVDEYLTNQISVGLGSR